MPAGPDPDALWCTACGRRVQVEFIWRPVPGPPLIGRTRCLTPGCSAPGAVDHTGQPPKDLTAAGQAPRRRGWHHHEVRAQQRPLPDNLTIPLEACRAVERAAGNASQLSRAVQATARLLRAAMDAGWTSVELGQVTGLDPRVVRKRVGRDRDRAPDAALPPVESKPPARQTAYARETATPAARRDWLTADEAADLAGTSRHAVRRWRHEGLLPNSRRVSTARTLYWRADVQRVMRAPKYHGLGPNYAAVLAEIARNGI